MVQNSIQDLLQKDLEAKEAFLEAQKYAFQYIDTIEERRVFPSENDLKALKYFHEKIPEHPSTALEIVNMLQEYGAKATPAQIGGRYFGFVNGNAVPAALATKWMTDVWDQCAGLYLTSPVNAEIETVCEEWLKDLFDLPDKTIAGFVSGTTMANLSALAAARFHLLQKQNWDIHLNGLHGAPTIRIIAHDQVHVSVKKTLVMLGYGMNNIEWVPSDDQGRIKVSLIPELDERSLIILQAGNVNTGAFDAFDKVCDMADRVGAWVHVDGAFGLWAATAKNLKYLTKGMNQASSWAVDGHKTLNTPYDCGIILCKEPASLVNALQATGEYITLSDQKDPLLTGPEMSKRARAIDLWATIKSLGRIGIDEMVSGFHRLALKMAEGLRKEGFIVLNEVVFNQVLVKCDDDEKTNAVLEYIQQSGECWSGGTTWNNHPAIRISICSWRTNAKDIERTIQVFKTGLEDYKNGSTRKLFL